MANIKGLVSISTIIACYHINGELCGDSCKSSNINAIEFENFTKLEGDKRNNVINFIIKDPKYGVSAIDKVEKECIIFKSNDTKAPNALFIFLFKEDIYKAQSNEKLKKYIKQLDDKKIFLLVGGIFPVGPSSFKTDILKTNDYNISKVNGNGNKYKFEQTIPGGGGDTSGMGGLGGTPTRAGMHTGGPTSPTGAGIYTGGPTSTTGAKSSPYSGAHTTGNDDDLDLYS